MSLIIKVIDKIRPPIQQAIRIIDIAISFLCGLVASIVLLGVAMIQEQKVSSIIATQSTSTDGSGSSSMSAVMSVHGVPTEDELASWEIPSETDTNIPPPITEIEEPLPIDNINLEQEIRANLEIPHPHSLGDHNGTDVLEDLGLNQEDEEDEQVTDSKVETESST